ncbi:hypothetical protein M378DRAFT_423376 [Amanita muscaria Koide BX008]|uniref:Uncharacterized protein n=1 Tax=Amanita muscaria (strain Koide BX008) TaxID=946122 RepID=A0A0C2WK17_AMAMK|nr:hypothetical protein M378DRAFT_423376 [Amanita muscaria Koide BX008]
MTKNPILNLRLSVLLYPGPGLLVQCMKRPDGKHDMAHGFRAWGRSRIPREKTSVVVFVTALTIWVLETPTAIRTY